MNTEQPAPAYDAINFEGTERRANYRTIAYREDILHICERKDAAAILYQIIYRWQTEVRRAKVLQEMEKRKRTGAPPLTAEEAEDMMWVYMSYNDFVRESGGAVAYNTVIRMLEYLITTVKIVEQRPNHDPRYAGYEYRINKAAAKEKLKALPAEPAFVPKVPKKAGQHGKTSTQMGRASTQRGTVVYPDGEVSQRSSHTLHRDSSQGDVLPASTEDAPLPDVRSQNTTQVGKQQSEVIPAKQTVACITAERSITPAYAIRTPTDEAGSAGREKTASTPALSTSIGTYPPACAKVSIRERTQSNKAAISAPAAIPLSPKARKTFDAWCTLFKVEVDLTRRTPRPPKSSSNPWPSGAAC